MGRITNLSELIENSTTTLFVVENHALNTYKGIGEMPESIFEYRGIVLLKINDRVLSKLNVSQLEDRAVFTELDEAAAFLVQDLKDYAHSIEVLYGPNEMQEAE